MKELEDITRERKLKGLTWDDLAKGLPINGNALRMAIVDRKKVQPEYLPIIRQNLHLPNTQDTQIGEGTILENEIPSYIIENEKKLMANQVFRLWLTTKIQEGVIKILGDR